MKNLQNRTDEPWFHILVETPKKIGCGKTSTHRDMCFPITFQNQIDIEPNQHAMLKTLYKM